MSTRNGFADPSVSACSVSWLRSGFTATTCWYPLRFVYARCSRSAIEKFDQSSLVLRLGVVLRELEHSIDRENTGYHESEHCEQRGCRRLVQHQDADRHCHERVDDG